MSGDTKKLIAFNYFGAKFTLADKLYPFFPKHLHFIDLFCGSLAVTLNKPKSKIETVNDINESVINFFKILRQDPDELIRLLHLTPTSRKEFNDSWYTEGDSDMERARKFYVRLRQSYCGMGAQRRSKGWLFAKTTSLSNLSETVSRWLNGVSKLPAIVDRLKELQLENRDFRILISAVDLPGAFFYCDPPYPKECRGSYGDYQFEFTDEDHRDLATLLNNIKGKAMISSYDCPLMRELYDGWYFKEFPIKHNHLRKGQISECIWMNYDPEEEKNKNLLFAK